MKTLALAFCALAAVVVVFRAAPAPPAPAVVIPSDLRDAVADDPDQTVSDFAEKARRLRSGAAPASVAAPAAAAPVECASHAAPAPPSDAAERIAEREYPSIFQAWTAASPPRASLFDADSRHDLAILSPWSMRVRWDARCTPYEGLATNFADDSVAAGRQMRAKLLGENPRMVFLLEIRYRDAKPGYLPPGPQWWLGKPGYKVASGDQYDLVRYDSDEYRRLAAAKCKAAVDSGVFDGCFLDWWTEGGAESDDRIRLLKTIREAVGDRALLMVNANFRRIPRSAAFVNGLFMEVTKDHDATPDAWATLTDTLVWAETAVREPRINALEIQDPSRADLPRMRLATATALVRSNGYALFADPDGARAPEHGHDWYPFWDKSLGRPRGAGFARPDGAWQREFERGTVVYNPMGRAPVSVSFAETRTDAAAGAAATAFTLAGGDGNLFLRPRAR